MMTNCLFSSRIACANILFSHIFDPSSPESLASCPISHAIDTRQFLNACSVWVYLLFCPVQPEQNQDRKGMDHRMDWARAAAYWLMGAKHLVIEAIKNNLHYTQQRIFLAEQY